MAHRILVVDDEDDVRDSLRGLLLTLPGCVVETASTHAEGTVKASSKDWDVIISDERLPDGSGTELLRRVALTKPATRLILMTAFQDFGIAVKAINHGRVDEFLQKPWDPEQVVQRLRRIMQETPGRPSSSHLQARTFRRIGGPGSGSLRP